MAMAVYYYYCYSWDPALGEASYNFYWYAGTEQ